jgi:hypothetical protein
MVLSEDYVPKRESLKRVLCEAYAEYLAPEQRRQILQYVWELEQLLPTEDEPVEHADNVLAVATRDATGEDVVSLICRFEDYLESLMVGAAAKKLRS